MSTTGQHLKGLEGTLGDKDPVLALLTEISANLKELNSTLKSHTTRLARLEDPRPGDESSPKERLLEKTSGKDDKISGLHSSEDGSVPKGNVEIEPGGNTMARDIKAITPRAEPSHPYKVIKTIEVRPGEIAPREAFDDSWGKSGRLGYDKCFLSWLKEKDLAFAFDGRQSIPFDILSLSSYLSLEEAQHGLHSVEKLLRELESNGGLFLIRENSGVLWDEIHTFDLVKNRLIADIPAPEPSTFYEEIAGSSGIPSSRNNWKIKAPFRRLWCVLHLSIEYTNLLSKVVYLEAFSECLASFLRMLTLSGLWD
jgi:hypothetical protein